MRREWGCVGPLGWVCLGRECEGMGVRVRRLRWCVFWAGSVLGGCSWVGAAFDRLVSSPWVLYPL